MPFTVPVRTHTDNIAAADGGGHRRHCSPQTSRSAALAGAFTSPSRGGVALAHRYSSTTARDRWAGVLDTSSEYRSSGGAAAHHHGGSGGGSGARMASMTNPHGLRPVAVYRSDPAAATSSNGGSRFASAAASLLPPKRWEPPPRFAVTMSSTASGGGGGGDHHRQRMHRKGLLRGGFVIAGASSGGGGGGNRGPSSSPPPAATGAVFGLLLHDDALRTAIHDGLCLLNDLKAATPSLAFQHTHAVDAEEWCDRALKAQRQADNLNVLAAIDAWHAWPCSERVVRDAFSAVAASPAGVASAPFGAPKKDAEGTTANGRGGGGVSPLGTDGGLAVATLAAAMSELQFVRRQTTILRGLTPLGASLPDVIGSDAIFERFTGRLRVRKQCCACNTRSVAEEPFLAVAVPPPAVLRRALPHRPRADALPAVALEHAIEAATREDGGMVRDPCLTCGRTGTEHRVDAAPTAWPANTLVVVMPDNPGAHAGDRLHVPLLLRLPEPQEPSIAARFKLTGFTATARSTRAQQRAAAEFGVAAVSGGAPLIPVTFLEGDPDAPCAGAGGRRGAVWHRVSPEDGVRDAQEGEVLEAASLRGAVLLYRRVEADADPSVVLTSSADDVEDGPSSPPPHFGIAASPPPPGNGSYRRCPSL